MSSLNEISTDQLGNRVVVRGEALLRPTTPLSSAGGQQRDMFFWPYHCIQDMGQGFKKFYDFCRTLTLFSVFGECAKTFQPLMRTLQGQYFNNIEMASYMYIRAIREQNAIKIFSLPNRKNSLCVFSLCAKWFKSCPKTSSTTRQKIFPSILDRMQRAKKLTLLSL